ncbi:hypothetical protein ACFWR9_05175 [Streptomyces sp. NPDC058534]|uniref:hypothetical protein n=1 Tax=Streptomyces sp. NPDC058534 TaxID=3346541 RepID=UPI003659F806
MIGGMEHLPTTQAVVTALRAIAAQYALEVEVTDDIGADQTSRRSAADVTTDAGLAFVKGRRFPPGYRLIVPLPGDRTHKEVVPVILLTPWLSGRMR